MPVPRHRSRAEGDGYHGISMTFERLELPLASPIPQAQRAIMADGSDRCTVLAQCNSHNSTAMPPQQVYLFSGSRAPYAHGRITTRRRHHAALRMKQNAGDSCGMPGKDMQ